MRGSVSAPKALPQHGLPRGACAPVRRDRGGSRGVEETHPHDLDVGERGLLQVELFT
jgi:hypothetical protein